MKKAKVTGPQIFFARITGYFSSKNFFRCVRFSPIPGCNDRAGNPNFAHLIVVQKPAGLRIDNLHPCINPGIANADKVPGIRVLITDRNDPVFFKFAGRKAKINRSSSGMRAGDNEGGFSHSVTRIKLFM